MFDSLLSLSCRRQLKKLGLKGNESVLDFGSGPGVMSHQLARNLLKGGGRLTHIDASSAWRDILKKRSGDYPNVDLVLGDIPILAIERDSFDSILIHSPLRNIAPYKRKQVVEVFSLALKGDGLLFIREPIGNRYDLPLHEIIDLMKEVGLKEIDFKISGFPFKGKVYTGIFRKSEFALASVASGNKKYLFMRQELSM